MMKLNHEKLKAYLSFDGVYYTMIADLTMQWLNGVTPETSPSPQGIKFLVEAGVLEEVETD